MDMLPANRADDELTLAAPGRHRVGELLQDADLISPRQVEAALVEQASGGGKFGDILFRMGMLTAQDRDVALEFQGQLVSDMPGDGKLRLGSILIASGQITREQLGVALQSQENFGGRLGATLVAAGYATLKQVASALLLQHKLVSSELLAAISLAALVAVSVPAAQAAQSSANLRVSVSIVAHARARTDYQATQLDISENDIAQGYVDVVSASRFAVFTNSRAGYAIDFHPLGELFQSVQISGSDQTARLGADGGSVAQRGVRTMSHELSYRFVLAAGLQPGSYPWPVQISVRPL